MGTRRMTGIWIILFVFITGNASMDIRSRRGIDLSQEKKLISESRLPVDIVPHAYKLDLYPNFQDNSFHGRVVINATVLKWTNEINLHSHEDMQIDTEDVSIRRINPETSTSTTETPNGGESDKSELGIRRTGHIPKINIFVIYLNESVKADTQLEIDIGFSGTIWVNPEGFFLGSYATENGTKHYLATNLRPNNARRLFPCFDHPSYKVPFTVSISRPKTYTTLFNTPVISTEPLDGEPETVVDHFATTPEISTYSLGFVISQFESVNGTLKDEENLKDFQEANPTDALCIHIYSRREFADSLAEAYDKVYRIQQILKRYLASPFPACELKIVALPNVKLIKPADSLGLILMRESDLQSNGYYALAQEITYQWIGHLVSPKWWSDSHLNKAIAGFLAVNVAMEVNQGKEFEGKWPMTILYSIYYEFSKRYPHSKITGMKEDTICSKTELLMRMLNATLGKDTFRRGIQQFVAQREHKTFTQDDLWDAITKEAHADGVLCKSITVNDIAKSWIEKDRIPLVTVNRDYEENTATVSQSVFLRERPHDVPDQDKMLWYIPLVVVREDDVCFNNATPYKWIKNERSTELISLPDKHNFVIINPEEIGPFPVNYDERNWFLLATYLKTEEGRNSIPDYTRAKLVHDAWNLGYGGHLNFSIALDMTLFMKDERNHLVWNPIFTMIDHIGRHIDISTTYKKFQKYVKIMLTPLYEELGAVQQPDEEPWKDNLRSLAKTFLCRMGYQPCIDDALASYHSWMKSENPDEGNPVSNQHICPVFQWGTEKEWDFGLMRVINFPVSRKQNERTFLLKTLASCPIQSEKIQKLLNVTILEKNGNFSERDISLVINMLTGGSTGYKTLLNFLSANWDVVKQRFENKTNLWDNLISSATGSFTTQEGYDMVSELYVTRQGEFGSAEHIIEKSLRNIKEETKWSNSNLPAMSQWLDEFIDRYGSDDEQETEMHMGR